MAELVSETLDVGRTDDGLLVVRHYQTYDNGARLGSDFLCEMSAAPWLADHIEQACEWDGRTELTQAIPPDEFLIFITSNDKTWETYVHVHNHRDPASPHGGNAYVVSSLTVDAARELAARIRALRAEVTPNA